MRNREIKSNSTRLQHKAKAMPLNGTYIPQGRDQISLSVLNIKKNYDWADYSCFLTKVPV